MAKASTLAENLEKELECAGAVQRSQSSSMPSFLLQNMSGGAGL